MKTVGVIGLGIMGSAMSANLVKARFDVCGYDVLPARRTALKKARGQPCGSAAEVAARAGIVITSLPSAQALHDVCSEIETPVTVIETSTLPIADKLLAREALAKKKVVLLDCPLSGTGAQARVGDLVVYGSGDKKAFESVRKILGGFSRSQHYVGEFGNGSRMKYVANLLVAIHNVAAAEAFVLGMKSGLDAEAIYRVIGDGAGSSRMFQVRGPQMVAGRYDAATMSVKLWQKDMQIIGDFATKLGAPTPLFNASAALYTAAMAQGFDKQDTASVCAVLEVLARHKR
jgi:3-hydroxyisobutyrate dehydrogenase-like beta-hydroxyacid dehydrogenase